MDYENLYNLLEYCKKNSINLTSRILKFIKNKITLKNKNFQFLSNYLILLIFTLIIGKK